MAVLGDGGAMSTGTTLPSGIDNYNFYDANGGYTITDPTLRQQYIDYYANSLGQNSSPLSADQWLAQTQLQQALAAAAQQASAGSTSSGDAAAAAATQQNQLQNQLQMEDLQSKIAQLQQQQSQNTADYNRQLGDVDTNSKMASDQANRQGVFNNENAIDSMAGRGLEMSGIRFGAQGRVQDALMRQLGNINSQAQMSKDAITRALQNMQQNTGSQIAGYQNQLNTLQGAS